MTTPPQDDGRYAFVYDEAMRGLEQQRQRLDGMRSRTATLLSAAAIATSFLGGVAFDDSKVGPAGYWASGLFAAVTLASIYLLLPQGDWHFRWGAKRLIEDYVENEEAMALTTMKRDLAVHADDNHEGNEKKLRKMMVVYTFSSVALGLEILLWLAEL